MAGPCLRCNQWHNGLCGPRGQVTMTGATTTLEVPQAPTDAEKTSGIQRAVVRITRETMRWMHEYNATLPDGKFLGKFWLRRNHGRLYALTYLPHEDPDKVAIHHYPVEVVEEGGHEIFSAYHEKLDSASVLQKGEQEDEIDDLRTRLKAAEARAERLEQALTLCADAMEVAPPGGHAAVNALRNARSALTPGGQTGGGS